MEVYGNNACFLDIAHVAPELNYLNEHMKFRITWS